MNVEPRPGLNKVYIKELGGRVEIDFAIFQDCGSPISCLSAMRPFATIDALGTIIVHVLLISYTAYRCGAGWTPPPVRCTEIIILVVSVDLSLLIATYRKCTDTHV